MRSELRRLALLCLVPGLLSGSARSASSAAATAVIRWTAPGDDSLSGRATAYDIRYSLTPITTLNFALASQATGMSAPKAAGSAESFTVPNLVAGMGYYFALKTVDESANWSGMSNVFYQSIVTATASVPLALSFSPPWPNPAHGTVRWTYSLPEPGPVVIDVFDVAGRHVATVAADRMAAGQGVATWTMQDDRGRAVAAGIYLVRASAGGHVFIGHLVVAN